MKNTDDGVAGAIQRNRSTDGAGITPKVGLPGGCAENCDVVSARDVVLIVEETASEWRYAEEREEIGGGAHAMPPSRFPVEHQRYGARIDGGVGGNLAETGLLFAPIEIVEIGGFAATLHLRAGLGDGDNAALILEWKRFEQEAVNATEDGGRGSNAEGQGENDRNGESGRFAQLAGGIAKITQQALHGSS